MKSGISFTTFAAIAFLVSGFQPTASYGYAGVNYTVDCKEYKRDTTPESPYTMEEVLRNSPLPIFDLLALTYKCPSAPGVAAALKRFFDYHDQEIRARGPIGTDITPGVSQEEEEASLAPERKKLNKMLADLRTGDVESLKLVLRYMIWQTDDNTSAYVACELMARLFPGDYDSLKGLTREGSMERDAWEENRDQWLKPQARGKKS